MVMGKKRTSLIAVMALALTVSMLATALLSMAAANAPETVHSKELSYDTGFRTTGVDLYDNFSRSFPVPATTKQMVTGDLNNDGRTDVAVIYENNVGIYYQKDDGGFESVPRLITFSNQTFTCIALGDMDGLGSLDVVVCYEGPWPSPIGRLQIFSQEQNFTPLIAPELTRYTPNAVGIGDFDLDGNNDVMVLSSSSTVNYFSIYHNDLGFVSIVSDEFELQGMQKATLSCIDNFDQNAGPDVAIADPITGNVSIWFNNNTASGYSKSNWHEGGRYQLEMPVSISSANVSSGNPALLVGDNRSASSKVWMWQFNPTSGRFEEIKKIDSPKGIGGAVGIDLDHLGGVDIATISKTGDNVTYYYTPTGAFKGPNGFFPGLGLPIQLVPADLNNDGWEDLMVLSVSSGTSRAITIYYSVQGKLSNANENILAREGMDSLFVGNFDRTGQMIGYLNQTENLLRFYLQGTWTEIGVSTGCRSAYSVSLYDPNYQDLVVLDPITGSILVYANSPDFLSQTTPTVVLSTSLENPRSIAVADMDASGTQDLIVGMEGGFVVYFNSGTFPGFSTDNNMTVDLAGSEAMHIVTGDFDVGNETGPRTIDVALVNASSNQLEIYFQGDGGIGFASSRSYTIPLSAR